MLHEILHIVFDYAQMEHGESDVVKSEHILWAIMADNPKMWDWIEGK